MVGQSINFSTTCAGVRVHYFASETEADCYSVALVVELQSEVG